MKVVILNFTGIRRVLDVEPGGIFTLVPDEVFYILDEPQLQPCEAILEQTGAGLGC